jgi:hypothetical protein
MRYVMILKNRIVVVWNDFSSSGSGFGSGSEESSGSTTTLVIIWYQRLAESLHD